MRWLFSSVMDSAPLSKASPLANNCPRQSQHLAELPQYSHPVSYAHPMAAARADRSGSARRCAHLASRPDVGFAEPRPCNHFDLPMVLMYCIVILGVTALVLTVVPPQHHSPATRLSLGIPWSRRSPSILPTRFRRIICPAFLRCSVHPWRQSTSAARVSSCTTGDDQ